VRGFITLSLMGWLAVAGGAALILSWGAVYVQTKRLAASQGEIAAFRAASQAAEEQAKKKTVADAKLKKEKDDETKRRIAGVESRYKRLLDANARGVLPPAEPADSVAGTTLVCFQRDQFESAINGFIRDAAGIALEGDTASIGLNVARSWAAELLRRQP
jgi:hypothetical protein